MALVKSLDDADGTLPGEPDQETRRMDDAELDCREQAERKNISVARARKPTLGSYIVSGMAALRLAHILSEKRWREIEREAFG